MIARHTSAASRYWKALVGTGVSQVVTPRGRAGYTFWQRYLAALTGHTLHIKRSSNQTPRSTPIDITPPIADSAEFPAASGREIRTDRRAPSSRPRIRFHLTGALAGGAACLVMLAVVIGVASLPNGSISPAGNGNPSNHPSSNSPSQLQAAAIDNLLTVSKTTRTDLFVAVQEVNDCTNLSAAISSLQMVRDDRAAELGTAKGLAIDALDSGSTIKSLLVGALSHSLSADKYYISWAQVRRTDGCSPANLNTTAHGAAESESHTADAYKEQFVALWNPLAEQLGLPLRTSIDL